MGLMNSALHIGRNALLGYQGALQVVGSNISGAGSADYTRLTPQLDSLPNLGGVALQPGAGVALTDIRRNIDLALENRLRLSTAEVESLSKQQAALAEIETYFDDLDGTGIPTLLSDFFGGFEAVGSDPEADRGLVVRKGEELAGRLKALRGKLGELGEGLDSQIEDLAVVADDLAEQIAELNGRITVAEARSRGDASGLRDQRDALLRKLGELVDVTVREQPNGVMNVYIGSEALVQGGYARGLTTATQVVDGFRRTSVVFADSGTVVRPQGGQIAGLMQARDVQAFGRIQELDAFVQGLIQAVNRVHADGQGLSGFSSMTGTYGALATDAALNSASTGLPYPVQNGAFHVVVSDGTRVGSRVHVVAVDLDGLNGDDTTLASLVERLNAIDHLEATLTPDNRVSLTADAGFTFSFGHDGQRARSDTSGALAALGLNTFFDGTNAADIAVNGTVVGDAQKLAASTVFRSGQGDNAAALAQLLDTAGAGLNTPPVQARWDAMAGDVAVSAAAVNSALEGADGIRSSLQAQRESISGVSLDEEAIEMIKYERAFQGAARYVSVVDQLIDEVMNIV